MKYHERYSNYEEPQELGGNSKHAFEHNGHQIAYDFDWEVKYPNTEHAHIEARLCDVWIDGKLNPDEDVFENIFGPNSTSFLEDEAVYHLRCQK
jgi:hypothetical protein